MSEDQQIDSGGAQTLAPRVFAYTYTTNLDQPDLVTDDYATSGTTTDDEQFDYNYLADGRLDTRTISKRPAGTWVS